MDCPDCGKPIPEKESCCPFCGEELLTPEERARQKWERKEQERKKKKQRKQQEMAAKLEPMEGPMADLVQSLVAELDELESDPADTPKESVEEAVDRAIQAIDRPELKEVEYEELDAEFLEKPTEPASGEESEPEEMAEEEPEKEAAPEEVAAEELPEESAQKPPDNPKEEAEPPKAAEETEKRSMLEQQGTVHINVEEALAALPQEDQDDIPDIRIPEIYARAKYIPAASQKWAEKAAQDVEDDWEGFDPDNEDWTEEEESSHPLVFLLVGIVLLVSVLLAMYAYFTSDLTGGIGLTIGSM